MTFHLFFFFNLYIYIFHCYLLYIYECIYCRKKISLVLPCKASAHKPSFGSLSPESRFVYIPSLAIEISQEGNRKWDRTMQGNGSPLSTYSNSCSQIRSAPHQRRQGKWHLSLALSVWYFLAQVFQKRTTRTTHPEWTTRYPNRENREKKCEYTVSNTIPGLRWSWDAVN